MKYKGQLVGKGQEFVMFFVFAGILLGAGALAIAGIQTSGSNQLGGLTSTIYNSTVAPTTGNTSFSLTRFATQLPTIGMIGGIALLILVLFIGFGMFIARRK